MLMIRFAILLLFCNLVAILTVAQVNPGKLLQLIGDDHKLARLGIRDPAPIRTFYHLFQNHPVWLNEHASAIRKSLYDLLQRAGEWGLNGNDYRYPQLQVLTSEVSRRENKDDSLTTDVLLTDVVIRFFTDVQNGSSAPLLKYEGMSYKPSAVNIPGALADAVRNGNLPESCAQLEPKSREYAAMKERLASFNRVMKEVGFIEAIVTSPKRIKTNTQLITRLYQWGLLQDADTSVSDLALEDGVKRAQELFNLPVDGKLGKATLYALNVSLASRREELVLALNNLRWHDQLRQTRRMIIVNIPSATLLVYDSGNTVLESNIIVGKPSTPTPSLSSKVTEVILYPYWMVPDHIATRELLPQIKKNVSYLERNSFQLLSRQGRVLNPYLIDWHSISAANFPFLIRQSTGCDNSLGIIKLNFYNPFTVYLHDTPAKQLFRRNERYFSHGCMRVEKALELGRFVLNDNRIAVDTISEKGCLQSQAPIIVPVRDPVNVVVLYSTVWYDCAGQIKFFEDIYKRNNRIAMARTD